jgi:hypothetical protein
MKIDVEKILSNFSAVQSIGKILILIGAIILLAGIILWLFGNKLNWLGNLPGDIKVEKENFKFYFPITTMILLSAVLTIIMWIIRRFLN